MATMYVFNPTKEDVTREMSGVEYYIPSGKAIEVEGDVGAFLVEARGEMAGIPPGGLTWFGLVPITAQDKVEDAAKRGLKNWTRLLTHRLLAIDGLIREGTTADGKQSYEVSLLEKAERTVKWKEYLTWAEAIIEGRSKYDGPTLTKDVKAKEFPKGVEFVQPMDNLDSVI